MACAGLAALRGSAHPDNRRPGTPEACEVEPVRVKRGRREARTRGTRSVPQVVLTGPGPAAYICPSSLVQAVT
jgi:hypothetical protein